MTTERLTRFNDTPKAPYLWVIPLVAAAIAVAIFAAGEIRAARGQAPDFERAFDNLLPLDDPAAMSNFAA